MKLRLLIIIIVFLLSQLSVSARSEDIEDSLNNHYSQYRYAINYCRFHDDNSLGLEYGVMSGEAGSGCGISTTYPDKPDLNYIAENEIYIKLIRLPFSLGLGVSWKDLEKDIPSIRESYITYMTGFSIGPVEIISHSRRGLAVGLILYLDIKTGQVDFHFPY
jgi:hypothetical protein